jgi:hypothetical protein
MEVDSKLNEFFVRVGSLEPPIRVRVHPGGVGFLILEQSHFLRTSIQYLPYAVREVVGDDPRAAFEALSRTILGFYDQAVRRGYAPQAAWLVPNSAYRDEQG